MHATDRQLSCMCVFRVALVRAVSSRCPCPTVRIRNSPLYRDGIYSPLYYSTEDRQCTRLTVRTTGIWRRCCPHRDRGGIYSPLYSTEDRQCTVHATDRPHHDGGMHCSSSRPSEVRPAGPPRLCGRSGRCGSGSSGISGAGTRTYGVGTGGGCVCSTRGHVGVWQGGGNQGSISAAGCSGRVTDVGGQVTRPRGATRPPRAQTSSLARAGLAYRSMGSTCTCS